MVKQIKLVKPIRNPQTGQTDIYVPLVISPTISKFGNGADRFQWILGAVVNGQFVKLCYLTDNQLEDFANRILETVRLKRFMVDILGEQAVEQRINQLYAQNKQPAQMPAPQPVQQPVNYPQPQPVMQQPAQQPAQMPAPQPVNYHQPQPVYKQPVNNQQPQKPNFPDIETV